MRGLNFKNKRHLPSILQTEHSECSLACLAMISGYYGHKIDINTLRNKYSVSAQGVTLKTIIKVAERMNMSSRAIRLEIDELDKLKLPAILHWDMNHFVVLKKVRVNSVVIHDPAVGVRKFLLKNVGEHFTGVALEITPTGDFTIEDEEKRLKFRELWNKATGMKRGLIQLLFLSLLLEIFGVSMPFYSQLIIDDVLVTGDYDLLKILAIGFSLLVIVRISTDILRSLIIIFFTNIMGFQLSVNVCRHLFKLPVDYFSKRHMGDIISRFNSTAKIKDFITSGIVSIIMDGLMALITLAMMLIYSKLLTLVTSLLVILYLILRFLTYRHIRIKNEELIVASAIENSNFMENIRNIQGIKLFNKESDRLSLWQNNTVDVINAGIRVQKFGILIKAFNEVFRGAKIILIFYLGAFTVLDNRLSIGMLMAFVYWNDTFFSKAFTLLDKFMEFRLLDIHLSRLSDIAFTKTERNLEGSNPPSIEVASKPLLEVKNLSFRYSENHPFIFSNVNLSIQINETIAITGPSGCGKSTLIKVLSSLFQPSGGEIKICNIGIYQMGLRHYRDRIGVVLQDDGLLTGSIADNISFFDSTPDQQLIEHAAEIAAVHRDIIAMPMQYNTLVGNLGAALSGGQIQRILLARAIYKNPELLFLDEATSHLDIEAEKMVNNSIKQLKMGRIIVAHRPETIKLADRIFFLTPQGLVPVEADQFH